MRRIRIICSDPYATDSSSNDEEEGGRNDTIKRIVYQIDIEQELTRPQSSKVLKFNQKVEVFKKMNMNEKKLEIKDKVAVTKNKKSPYPGVRLRPSGRWSSQIRNRVTGAIHLGTFDTAEAAYEAYCAKKLEFDGKVAVEKNKESPYLGVCFDHGCWRPEIRFGGNQFNLGRFETAEEVHKANCAKRRELEEKAELLKKQKTASETYCAKKLETNGKVPSKETELKQAPEASITKKLGLNDNVVMVKNKRSPYVGAYFRRGQWTSNIRFGGKQFHLGTFETAEAAHEAYCGKKRELEEKAGFNKKAKKSPYLGVYLDRGHWRSEIYFGGNRFNLGRFETAEAAHEAYCAKKRELEEKAEAAHEAYCAKKRELEEKAELSEKQKAASDEDTDPIRYNLRTRKRASRYNSSSCKSNSCIGCSGSDTRVGKRTKLPLISGKGVTKTLHSHYCNDSITESGALDSLATGGQDPKFDEKSMLGEKAAFQEVEKAAFDYGYGSISKEMASLIVDDNGFLLGDYSQIDDLSIC